MKDVPFHIDITHWPWWLLGASESIQSSEYDLRKQDDSPFFCFVVYEFTFCKKSNDENGFLQSRSGRSIMKLKNGVQFKTEPHFFCDKNTYPYKFL